MRILDVPFILEIFFIISTVVFLLSLYTILPGIISKKNMILKPPVIDKFWHNYGKRKIETLKKTFFPSKKKEENKLFFPF